MVPPPLDLCPAIPSFQADPIILCPSSSSPVASAPTIEKPFSSSPAQCPILQKLVVEPKSACPDEHASPMHGSLPMPCTLFPLTNELNLGKDETLFPTTPPSSPSKPPSFASEFIARIQTANKLEAALSSEALHQRHSRWAPATEDETTQGLDSSIPTATHVEPLASSPSPQDVIHSSRRRRPGGRPFPPRRRINQHGLGGDVSGLLKHAMEIDHGLVLNNSQTDVGMDYGIASMEEPEFVPYRPPKAPFDIHAALNLYSQMAEDGISLYSTNPFDW
ncbi:hypothetical protein H0H81_002098 [Sphagnurus paluster]|uniref:Uncharacterized protein n=1 Tax=Sphagnurus paluster TaxID=117069 RepID=A0A9P7GFR1_9AGAR|nr:hypothetical protein H0H81_002098 [Sphagnurus paluster]